MNELFAADPAADFFRNLPSKIERIPKVGRAAAKVVIGIIAIERSLKVSTAEVVEAVYYGTGLVLDAVYDFSGNQAAHRDALVEYKTGQTSDGGGIVSDTVPMWFVDPS